MSLPFASPARLAAVCVLAAGTAAAPAQQAEPVFPDLARPAAAPAAQAAPPAADGWTTRPPPATPPAATPP